MGGQEGRGPRRKLLIKDIRSLYFGEASAEREVSENPERFLRTYLDVWGVEEKLLANDFFLILGPKGSGKTAVGEFSRLTLERRFGVEKVLSVTRNMDELAPNIAPLSALTSKLVGEDTQGVTATAWRLYIGLQLAALAIKDQAGSLASDWQFLSLWRQLNSSGLISAQAEVVDFPTVLRRVREGRLSFSAAASGIAGSAGAVVSDTDELSVTHLGEFLMDTILNAHSSTRYLLVIDGLDRVIGENRAYWLSVSGLLMAAADIHMRIRRERSNVTLMVMCRTDVFRRVNFADADKIAGDSSVFVDWANHQTRIVDSYLWDYLARKAEVTVEELLALLPDEVVVGPEAGDRGNPSKG